MPDPTGKLSPAEKQKISETINAKWAGRSDACPICGEPHWLIADHFVATTTLGPHGAFQLGGQIYPLVMTISPCGYTRFFNAVTLGVYPVEKTPKEVIQHPPDMEKK
jgi:hypothetical protein